MKYPILTMAFVITLACSRLPSTDEETYAIHGTWESSCVSTFEFDLLLGRNMTVSRQSEIEFRESNVIRTDYKYDSGSCDSDELSRSIRFSGKFTLDEEQLASDATIKDLDIRYLTVEIKAYSQSGKDYLTSKYQGNDLGIEVGQTVDISDISHGEQLLVYDIFQIEEDSLYFGNKTNDLDGTGTESRPDSINMTQSDPFIRL